MPEAAPSLSSPSSPSSPAASSSPRRPSAAVRLRAATRRVPRRPAGGAPTAGDGGVHPDEAAPTPGIRLSRALGVMLLLHVVAVGGVLAFGLIKERPVRPGGGGGSGGNRDRVAGAGNGGNPSKVRGGGSGGKRPEPVAGGTNPAPTADNAPTPFPPAIATSAVDGTPTGVGANSLPPRGQSSPAFSRAEADAVRLIESGGPNPVGGGAAERAYVVGRGETIQGIAQKLRVDPAALLRLNNLDDPRKLQPGQRLRVPPSSSPSSSGRSRS